MEKSGENQVVYIIHKELPPNPDSVITGGYLIAAIKQSLDLQSQKEILCVQKEGGLWLVYLKRSKYRKKLLTEGLMLNEIYPKGVLKLTREGYERVIVCGLPCHVKNDDVMNMLTTCGVEIINEKVYEEKISVPGGENGWNGNRYVYIKPLTSQTIPRYATCNRHPCRLYHWRQITTEPERVKCYSKVCRVCLLPDHNPGSTSCKYENKHKDIIILKKDNPLSMYYKCEIHVYGQLYESAADAYSTIRTGKKDEAHDFETGLESVEWRKQKKEIMADILNVKLKLVHILKELETVTKRSVFAEATHNLYWGTGLSEEETINTEPLQWPGKNHLGSLIKEIAMKKIERLTFYSLNTNGLNSDKKTPHLFKWLIERDFGIVLLQETHFTDGDACKPFEKDFYLYPSHSSSKRSKGVLILVNRKCKEIKTLDSESDSSKTSDPNFRPHSSKENDSEPDSSEENDSEHDSSKENDSEHDSLKENDCEPDSSKENDSEHDSSKENDSEHDSSKNNGSEYDPSKENDSEPDSSKENDSKPDSSKENDSEHDSSEENDSKHDSSKESDSEHDSSKENDSEHDSPKENDSEPDSSKENNSEKGRKVEIKVKYKENIIHLINVYAPIEPKNRVFFFKGLFDEIDRNCKDKNNIMIVGDFNCHIDNEQKDEGDRCLEYNLKKYGFIDAWATGSGRTNEEGRTYRHGENIPITRIDYVFVRKEMIFPLFDIFTLEAPQRENGKKFSDHLGLCFELNAFKALRND